MSQLSPRTRNQETVVGEEEPWIKSQRDSCCGIPFAFEQPELEDEGDHGEVDFKRDLFASYSSGHCRCCAGGIHRITWKKADSCAGRT